MYFEVRIVHTSINHRTIHTSSECILRQAKFIPHSVQAYIVTMSHIPADILYNIIQ